MSLHLRDVNHRIGNAAVTLNWTGGVLQAQNLLSGQARRFGFPAFAVSIGGRELMPEDFDLIAVEPDEHQIIFAWRCNTHDMQASVRYWLDGEQPWVRKQVRLQAPVGTPTPDRLWVELQNDPPSPIRRVGYGLRGGLDAEQQEGRDTYAEQPGCGYPVFTGDWFFGLEHPAAFAVPDRGLELYHHPVWDENSVIHSFSAVMGVAQSHEAVPEAFMDYLWQVRNPRLTKPLYTVSTGWATRAVGGGDYVCSFEAIDAFLDAMLQLGLHPDALAVDAGYFDRASLFHGKEDDEDDSKLIALREKCRQNGLKLSLWVSHNGRTGMDMDWIRRQGWSTGDGPGTYHGQDFVVMMQPSFEEALARRFERLVGPVGADHLKIDWDNDCATAPKFAATYPTVDHVREASLMAFNRIDRRMRAQNPNLLTRNGWWPSPWWLQWADHVWLVNSGDCEYESWPSRTQRDRDNTHRDAMYHQITVKAETPVPLDAWDNHGFADAPDNPFHTEPHTWLDNLVLQFTRGTTYLHMPFCPETLRQWQADYTQAGLEWLRFHADELGTRHSRMVLGNPALGEIYGFLHPFDDGAWLVLRNPSVEPQSVDLPLNEWLGFSPATVRQVHPYWQDLSEQEMQLSGHEVVLLRCFREAQPDASPLAGVPFMVQPEGDRFRYLFPGNRPVAQDIGPTVHPTMQIPDIETEVTEGQPIENGRRLQWYVGVPHRFERAEVLVTLRGPQDVLDRLTVKAGQSRYRGVAAEHVEVVTRIFRKETRGYGTRRFMLPPGPRDRDDYVFPVPDGGYSSVTVDVLGPDTDHLSVEAWLQGYEAPARQTLVNDLAPCQGPLLPMHPYGFARWKRLET
jgi:hypothetical protein